jgi:hypothetical protein
MFLHLHLHQSFTMWIISHAPLELLLLGQNTLQGEWPNKWETLV